MMKRSDRKKTLIMVGWMLILFTGGGLALDSASEHFSKGVDSFEANNMVEAANEFEHAFHLAPGEPKIQYWLGRTLIQESGPNKTANLQHLIDLFEKLSDEQQSADSLYWLGRAYAENGDNVLASEKLRAALKKPAAYYVKEQQIRETLRRQLREGDGADNGLNNILVLCALLILAFLFIVGLKQFVFVTPSTRRDLLMFFLILLVFVFAALVFGWIDGGQFIAVIKSILQAS